MFLGLVLFGLVLRECGFVKSPFREYCSNLKN